MCLAFYFYYGKRAARNVNIVCMCYIFGTYCSNHVCIIVQLRLLDIQVSFVEKKIDILVLIVLMAYYIIIMQNIAMLSVSLSVCQCEQAKRAGIRARCEQRRH